MTVNDDRNGLHYTDREKRMMRFWVCFVRTAKLIETEINSKMLRTYGVRFVRFDVLSQLYRVPGGRMTIGELGASTLSHSGNISALIYRMETDGLVRRIADPTDRRRFLIEMTDDGLKQFHQLAKANAGWIATFFSGIDDVILDRLTENLQSIAKRI